MGLLSDRGRKNCWTLAELAGHPSPDRLQHLLTRAVWEADEIRDDLRDYVHQRLQDRGAVLVVDETGDLKKGTATVGVQRQYTGTAGRVENSQVAVYLAYATTAGHALIDRALYLPRCWADDPLRRAQAGVPAEVEFATKPALAGRMIAAALEAGVAASWVAGDEVYGADPALRAMLHTRRIGYVLGVASNRAVLIDGEKRLVSDLAASLPKGAWRQHVAGIGTKGKRWYSWALVELDQDPDAAEEWVGDDEEAGGLGYVLIRRNDATGELAYFRAYSPNPVTVAVLAKVAGQRWKVEESFQTAKGLTGLDQHQVRRWTSWHRWVTLAMLAHAFLVVLTAAERSSPHPKDLIPLTVNEFRRLFEQLVLAPLRRPTTSLTWSCWRRRHQARARKAHHRRRENLTRTDLRL